MQMKTVANTWAVTAIAIGLAALPASVGAKGSGDRSGRAEPTVTTQVEQAFPPAKGLDIRVFSTGQSRLQAGTPNQGWWGSIANFSSNDNYIVGAVPSDGFVARDFFTFDLSSLGRHVVFARLDIFSATLEGDPIERLGLFDVSTPAATLNANNGRNRSVYDDLGSGTSYGVFDVDTKQDDQWLSLRLNQAAVRDINTTRRWFSIGGRLLSTGSTNPDVDREFLFGFSHNRGLTIHLVVKTAPRRAR